MMLPERGRAMNRPNILYIHSHDTGRYVQPCGHAVATPRIARLAGQGMLFTGAFCAAPTCSPRRAAMLTGQCAHSSGMLGLVHRGFALREPREHLAGFLREAGYFSALFGVQHEAGDPRTLGYELVWNGREHAPAGPVSIDASQWRGDPNAAARVAPAAAEFLRSAPRQPFFLSVGFYETHRDFPPPTPEDDPERSLPPANLPDAPETRRDFAAFKASARALDAGVGAVLDALADAGLAENTLVICTTDHGIAFPGMKCNLTDAGIAVMLILRGPGGFSGGRVSDALVSHLDVFPTVCALAGAEPPGWLQGRSLLPLLRGELQEINEEVFAEVSYHAAYEPMRAARTKRWKYIRRFGGRTRPVLANCDDSPSKEVWVRAGWAERPVTAEQLYDLVFDPQERCNLAAEPAVQEALGEMRVRLERWMRATDDPLLAGPVAAPPGARVNSADDLSPRAPTRPAS